MPISNEGHNAPQKDPFELDDQTFQDTLATATHGAPEGEDPTAAAGPASSQQGDAPEDFSLSEPEDPGLAAQQDPAGATGAGGAADEMVEIVHRGQAHKVTKAKLIELAQKGFDYDHKVGPAQNIVKLLQTDPEAAQVLNAFVRQKYMGQGQPQRPRPPERFQALPYKDFTNEHDWLAANLERYHHTLMSNLAPVLARRPGPAAPPPDPSADMERLLLSHDPQGYRKVLPHLPEFAKRLRMEDYSKVDGSVEAFLKFYDFVRDRVLASPTGQGGRPAQARAPQPGFRMPSGGGTPPRNAAGKNSPDYAWTLPLAEFDQVLENARS